MQVKVYEVRKFEVETEDGLNAYDKFIEMNNQTTTLLKTFDSLEDATAFYSSVPVSVREMGSYYLHHGKCLEVNIYEVDEDGDKEWLFGGDWILFDLPDLK